MKKLFLDRVETEAEFGRSDLIRGVFVTPLETGQSADTHDEQTISATERDDLANLSAIIERYRVSQHINLVKGSRSRTSDFTKLSKKYCKVK